MIETRKLPVEPTESMLTAFHTAVLDWLNEKGEDADVYKAMVNAYEEETND